ncbi:hypothetical protein D3C75_1349600 [compost metagenome]
MGVNNLGGLRFRKKGLPRKVSIELGNLFENESMSDLIINWKKEKDIPKLSWDDDLKEAIITLI